MDRRTKRQKLEDMARQTVSPHEAEIARAKLAAMSDTHTVEKPKTRMFINGQEVGFSDIEFSYSFDVAYDPGIGSYDFVHEKWNWTPRPSGIKIDDII